MKEKPILDIRGNQYKIDLKNRKFKPLETGVKPMTFNDFDCEMAERSYFGYYDLQKKEAIKFTDDISEYPPPHIVAVYFPEDRILDPVAFAELHGQDYDPEMDFPFMPLHEAYCGPVEESYLADTVMTNQEKARTQSQPAEKNSQEKVAGGKKEKTGKIRRQRPG